MTPQEFYALDPVDRVLHVFEFPSTHIPAKHQADSVNRFGETDGHGCWDKPGTGKTFTMTLHALLSMSHGERKQWVVLCPPAVIPNWVRWLRQIKVRSTGAPITALAYVGTPKQRAKLDLGVHFVVMSYELFKGDYERLTEYYFSRPHSIGLICDEAHKIKNMDTANFKHVRAWKNEGAAVKMATGTPVTTPLDIYAYTRIKNPESYRNIRDFYVQHVVSEDGYERVTEWQNLEKAKDNLLANATMTLREDIVGDMPRVSIDPWTYALAPDHQRLYNQLAEEKLLELERSGETITALTQQALFHKCQQLVINYPHFSGKPDVRPAGIELVEQWLDELGDEKLIVVANYQLSNAYFLEALKDYGAVVVWGRNSYNQNQKSISTFIEDPKCRVMVMQPEAGGVGVDGLQHVCHSMLFMECPPVSRQFEQAVARVDRTGQQSPVQIRVGVANQTLQVGRYKSLLQNDDLVSSVQRTHRSLRDMIYGRDDLPTTTGAPDSGGSNQPQSAGRSHAAA